MKPYFLKSREVKHSKIVVEAVFDGDVQTKMKDFQYSTLVRSIFTVGDMVKYHEMRETK